MCHAALERLARESLRAVATARRLCGTIRLSLIRLIDKAMTFLMCCRLDLTCLIYELLTFLMHHRLGTCGCTVERNCAAPRSEVVHEVRVRKLWNGPRNRCGIIDARWRRVELQLIAHRVRVWLTLLKVAMKVDAWHVPPAFLAIGRRVSMEAANLTEGVCAWLCSASDMARRKVPVNASCVQARVLIDWVGLSWRVLVLEMRSRHRCLWCHVVHLLAM